MHPLIEKKVQKILEGPIDDMLPQWKLLNQEYAQRMTISFERYAGQDNASASQVPSISLEDAVEALNLIGPKIFTKNVSRSQPELVLEFMDEYWGYVESEEARRLMNTNIYKDASSIILYRSIIFGKMHPDANPYFGYDPEHPLSLGLSHGVSRGLFTQDDVDDVLRNQDRTSDLCKRISELNSQLYTHEHEPFGIDHFTGEKKYESYGCHSFIGREYYALDSSLDKEKFSYVILTNCGSICNLGENLENVAEHLWHAVRRKQKVLLTKNPGGRFEKFSDDELLRLYDIYFSEPKRKALPDPFLGQPR